MMPEATMRPAATANRATPTYAASLPASAPPMVRDSPKNPASPASGKTPIETTLSTNDQVSTALLG